MASSKAAAAIDDPRQSGFPCYGQHKGKTRQNQYATWVVCLKCGIRLEYQTKKAGHGGTRQMGPDPQIIRLALADIEKSMEASEVTMDVVNGKMMEIKGKMLQMGIPTPLQLNMTLDEYHQRLEKFGRMDGVPMTPSTKAPSSAARSSPSEVPSSPEPKKASQKKGVPPEGPLEKEIKEMAIKGYLAAKKEKELDVTKGTPQMIPDGPEVVMIHSEEEEWEAPTEKGKASGDP